MRTIPQPLAGRRFAVLTLLLGGFTAFGPLSMDLYLPAFPELAADLHASQAAVQLTLTADVIGLVVGQLVLGPLSDARGRRRLLMSSTLVCAIASVLCALAPSVGWLTVWRFLQGASGGGGIVLARAVAADVASGVAAARLFSLFMTVSSVAPIAAPVLGGALLAATGCWPRSACCSPSQHHGRSPKRCLLSAGTRGDCGALAAPSLIWPATACSPAMTSPSRWLT